MYIFEEYLTRHSFDVAYARHTPNSSIFYRHDNQWKVMTIRWAEQGNHPGCYIFRYMEPVGHRYDKNGNDRSGITFRRNLDDAHIWWEEYENYLIEWAKKVSYTDIAHGIYEAKLAAWEICLYCFDALLIGYANNENFYNTINLELPVSRRLQALDRILGQIARDEHSRIRDTIVNFWEGEILGYIGNQSDWLVKLVERYGNQTR